MPQIRVHKTRDCGYTANSYATIMDDSSLAWASYQKRDRSRYISSDRHMATATTN